MIPKYSSAQHGAGEPQFAKAPRSTQAFILVTGADGLTVWVNGAFERVMGYTSEEMEGRRPGQILEGPGAGRATAEAMARALRAGRPIQTTILNYKKNGAPIWVDLEIRPLLDKAARPIGFVYSGRAAEGRALCGRALDAKPYRLIEPVQSTRMAVEAGIPAAGREPAARPAHSAGPYRVLVAEDHPINLKLVAALLQAGGFEARCVQNGRQALAEFDIEDFDLVIMDSQMPVMTGIEAISVIRSRSDWKRFIPILSLTAHAMKGAEEYHTSAGADLYMSKPLSSGSFIGAVNRLAKQGRQLSARHSACTGGFLPAI
jgi:PAS domain S-box-containing protein